MKATVKEVREKHNLGKLYDAALGDFPCRSFNLGQQSLSSPHTDNANLAQGWCSITPLGSFDHKKGGHLILWDFGLMIEFPAGSTVLIPSALIIHSNTSLGTGETRFCIVQYAAGGLFRWVENGFMTEENWLAKASKEERQAHDNRRNSRWADGVEMFTKLDELRSL